MQETESRLTDGFPAILMTLVSLIVALTIETVREIPGLFRPGHKNFFTWSQALGKAVLPLQYRFTMSLHSTALRGSFVPRDVLGPLVPGFVFIPLAPTVGAEGEATWLLLF